MTLQPYDGANRVLLPDGRECWEKDTEHFDSSETTLSYQYSDCVDGLPKDYWGRVVGLKVKAPDGTWNEPVAFLPVTASVMHRVMKTMQTGWSRFANYEAAAGAQQMVMGSTDYCKVMEDVLAILDSARRRGN